MKLEISSHHIIDLIQEDIKLNHLVFGLKEIGLECDPELLNLSPIIFKICGVDMETDMRTIEDYYNSMNENRGKSFKSICDQLPKLSHEYLKKLIK